MLKVYLCLPSLAAVENLLLHSQHPPCTFVATGKDFNYSYKKIICCMQLPGECWGFFLTFLHVHLM